MLEDQELEGTQEAREPAEAAAGAQGSQPEVADTGIDEEVDADSQVDPELLKLYEESMMDLEEGEIVRGTILKVDEKEVLVDVGFKSEGVIPIEEFGDVESIKVGDQVDVFLEKMENQDGLVVLSKQRADFVKVWDRVKDAADTGSVVEGRLLRKIKGGVVVDLFGVEAFLPGSQIALRQVQNVDDLLGRTMKFKIIKLNKRRRNIVVSRRSMLEEEREEMKTKVLSELAKDQIREGVVKNITDFGAFVDLGGIDGLLHITDMSWGRISHPSEVVAIGDKVTVKVLNFDRERERISLGLKQLTPYPWEDVDKKYAVGDRVKGKVVSITDYGAFVELEKGVEGLIHVSEMSWTKHIRHPSKVLAVGENIEAVVLKVDKDNEKISLGLKQIEPDPWLTLEERYPVGSRISGKVRNLTNFGAFVELEEGIDGLVHISDMSWTRRIGHPSEVLKKGETVEVVVLSVDKDARRVSLGLKQVSEDPWPIIAEKYTQDTVCTGKIVRVLEKGVVVDLGDDLEGFVPISQLGVENLKKPADAFSEGDEIPLKATRVDIPNHRIVLSVRAYMSAQDQAIIEEYKAKHAPKPSTIGDVASDEVKEAGAEKGAESGESKQDKAETREGGAAAGAVAGGPPETAAPGTEAPQAKEPEAKEPGTEAPGAEAPQAEEPGAKEPEAEAPQAEDAEAKEGAEAQTESSETPASESAPKADMPEGDAPAPEPETSEPEKSADSATGDAGATPAGGGEAAGGPSETGDETTAPEGGSGQEEEPKPEQG
jgi:small subunit ribosomal protein S1